MGERKGTGDSGGALHAHDPTHCVVCTWIGRCAVALLDAHPADKLTPEQVCWQADVRPETFAEHFRDVDQALLVAYQQLLDRMTDRTAVALAQAPSFEAGLFEGVRQALAEMEAQPGAFRLHYVEASRAAGDGALLRARDDQRDQLVVLLSEARDDGPDPIEAEMLLGMIHTTLRQQTFARGGPHPVEEAEHDLAPLLFQFVPFTPHPAG